MGERKGDGEGGEEREMWWGKDGKQSHNKPSSVCTLTNLRDNNSYIDDGFAYWTHRCFTWQ